MKPSITVIICTHNPKQDYLRRVLQALKFQTLSTELWELLLIDNASSSILSSKIDLSWHPNAHHVREEQLGLTPARLRGIITAKAEVIVFVDDDNVLDSDYLEVTLQISKNFPPIGAWGGQILPEFEKEPPEWTKPYWPMLAIRQFERDSWSNLLHQHQTTPCGAGLCVRKVVADKYAELVRENPKRLGMGRKGKRLTSCEDTDLAFTACDIGYGTGQFTSLKLTHLIPPHRLEEEYLLRLTEGLSYSGVILKHFRDKLSLQQSLSWRQKILHIYFRLRVDSRTRRFFNAKQKAIALARKEIGRWQSGIES
ncbi:MAG: glycosyltransferase [Moorea sp. SIO2I5]|nr:glycosyltransferase [Moorena sp. SIO2I5]